MIHRQAYRPSRRCSPRTFCQALGLLPRGNHCASGRCLGHNGSVQWTARPFLLPTHRRLAVFTRSHEVGGPSNAAAGAGQGEEEFLAVFFSVHLHCKFGEAIGILGSAPGLGQWNTEQPVPVVLKYAHDPRHPWLSKVPTDTWHGWAVLPAGTVAQYKYVLVDANHGNRFKGWIEYVAGGKDVELEVKEFNVLQPGPGLKTGVLPVYVAMLPCTHQRDKQPAEGTPDIMAEDTGGRPFILPAQQEAASMRRHQPARRSMELLETQDEEEYLAVAFTADWHCNHDAGEAIGILGSCVELGNWDTQQPVPVVLEPAHDPHDSHEDAQDSWFGWAELPAGQMVEYKYVLVDVSNGNKFIRYLDEMTSQNVMLEVKAETCITLRPGLTCEVLPS